MMISIKPVALVLLIVIVVGAEIRTANAYEFQQKQFNDVLLREIMELNHRASHFAFRSKRDADGAAETDGNGGSNEKESDCSEQRKGPFSNCCASNTETPEYQKKIDELKGQCFNEVRGGGGNKSEPDGAVDVMSCANLNSIKEDFLCITHCVAKKLNIIYDNGTMIESSARRLVMNELSAVDWQKAIAAKVADSCLQEVQNVELYAANSDRKMSNGSNSSNTANDHGGHAKHQPQSSRCSPTALHFTFCVWRQFIKACPKEMQSNTSECIQLLTDLQSKVDE